MKNLIIFLSTFTATILIVIFASAPAHAESLAYGYRVSGSTYYSTPQQACAAYIDYANQYNIDKGLPTRYSGQAVDMICDVIGTVPGGSPTKYPQTIIYIPPADYPGGGGDFNGGGAGGSWPEPEPDDGDGECVPCNQLALINQKLNALNNNDIIINNVLNDNSKVINQTIYDMSQTINNIDNSITDLSVNQSITNNNLTLIDNSLTNLITNIENNNITNNEIKNEINNISNEINNYSLQLGDIKLAMGDIDVKLDNTNKLVLGLKPDIEFIKNNLVNGSPEGKDYTEQLNEIIELLKPCEPTAEIPCPDDDAVVKKLKEIQDYMQADFVPDTDSTAVEVEDLTDIELDRNLIKFGVAQCPPDNEFSTMVNGFSFSGGFKHKPLCDFFTLLSPFIKAFGGFSAALILGGGLRRG